MRSTDVFMTALTPKLRVGKSEGGEGGEKNIKTNEKKIKINTTCVTSCWLIPFHSIVMTTLLSASALDGDTFKEQT